jgi:type II secretory pathway component GspD/PulD (secretin)
MQGAMQGAPMMNAPLFQGNFNMQQDNSWSNLVSNSNPWAQRPIGTPWMQANPQFGGRQGQQGQQGGRQGQGQGGQGGQGGGGVFELPEGIDSMVAIDAQNTLLVRGTAEAVEELQQLIELIDQPLRQVEIEAQFVTLSNSNAKFFGIDFSGSALPFTLSATTNPNNVTGNFNVGIVSRNFQATLNSLVSNSRAKIVTAPRVVAINNLTASLQSTTVTTVLLPQAAINPGNGGGNNVIATAQVPFQIFTSIGITVAPTINGDGTITVLMQPQVQQQGTPTPSNPIPTVSSQTIQTVAIVRDGDTIALGGLRNKSIQNTRQKIPFLGNIPIIGKLFQSLDKSERDEDLIIFLTARELRRLDDTQPVPGT